MAGIAAAVLLMFTLPAGAVLFRKVQKKKRPFRTAAFVFMAGA
jgi:hypothetical protein